MKFLFFFLSLCVFGASCTVLNTPVVGVGDKIILNRQKDILRLLDRVYMDNTNLDQREIGQKYNILMNVDKYEDTVDVKRCFYNLGRGHTYRDLKFVTTTTNTMGTLGGLPKHQAFVITNFLHRKEAICLFNVLYHAKNYDTFYKTACWAREYCNEDLFTYALTVAVKHRKDCTNFMLPALYEITPFKFVNNDVIQKIQHLKMQGKIINHKKANIDGVFQNGKVITVYDNNLQVQLNKEQKLTYFTDDIGLNTHYFNIHTNYPFWMDTKNIKWDINRRGEFFFYYHQQLLARYYLERLSNGLGEIPNFYWKTPIDTGFVSTLRLNNGMTIANRPNKHLLTTKDNFFNILNVLDCERVIRDTVRRGFIFTKDGGIVKIRSAEDINILGNFIQGNMDSVNTRIVDNCFLRAKHLLGNGKRVNKNNDRKIQPGAMDFYETCLRDPMFYQLNKRFMYNFFLFKNNLPTYTHDELFLKGVEVEGVNVDKLITFFDHFDVDVTNAVYRTEDEKIKNKDDLVFVARQTRLNHKQFKVRINVNSEKATDVVVRMFIGPKYDGMGNKLNINENRHNFFEIDSFMYNLKVGKQVIVRDSRDFLVTCDDPMSTRNFMTNIKDTMTNDDVNTRVVTNTCQGHNLFPDRLLLPKGKKGGMKFKFFVIINDLHVTKTGNDKFMNTNLVIGGRRWDQRAFGYPFDRRINRNNFFHKNMFLTDITIYHGGFLNNKVKENTGFLVGDDSDIGFMGNDKFLVDNIGFVTGGNTGFMNTDNTFMNTDNTGFMGGLNTGVNTDFYNTNTGFYNDNTNTGFVDTNTGFVDTNTGFLGVNDRMNVDNTGFVQTKNY